MDSDPKPRCRLYFDQAQEARYVIAVEMTISNLNEMI